MTPTRASEPQGPQNAYIILAYRLRSKLLYQSSNPAFYHHYSRVLGELAPQCHYFSRFPAAGFLLYRPSSYTNIPYASCLLHLCVLRPCKRKQAASIASTTVVVIVFPREHG